MADILTQKLNSIRENNLARFGAWDARNFCLPIKKDTIFYICIYNSHIYMLWQVEPAQGPTRSQYQRTCKVL